MAFCSPRGSQGTLRTKRRNSFMVFINLKRLLGHDRERLRRRFWGFKLSFLPLQSHLSEWRKPDITVTELLLTNSPNRKPVVTVLPQTSEFTSAAHPWSLWSGFRMLKIFRHIRFGVCVEGCRCRSEDLGVRSLLPLRHRTRRVTVMWIWMMGWF